MDMNAIGAAFALFITVVNWMIINPLKVQMAASEKQTELSMQQQKENTDRLIRTIEKLTDILDVTRGEVNEIRERVAKVESSCSSAHKRLDAYEKEVHK